MLVTVGPIVELVLDYAGVLGFLEIGLLAQLLKETKSVVV